MHTSLLEMWNQLRKILEYVYRSKIQFDVLKKKQQQQQNHQMLLPNYPNFAIFRYLFGIFRMEKAAHLGNDRLDK